MDPPNTGDDDGSIYDLDVEIASIHSRYRQLDNDVIPTVESIERRDERERWYQL